LIGAGIGPRMLHVHISAVRHRGRVANVPAAHARGEQWTEKRELTDATQLAAQVAKINSGRDRLAAAKKEALTRARVDCTCRARVRYNARNRQTAGSSGRQGRGVKTDGVGAKVRPAKSAGRNLHLTIEGFGVDCPMNPSPGEVPEAAEWRRGSTE
jgi:hypothetical protein